MKPFHEHSSLQNWMKMRMVNTKIRKKNIFKRVSLLCMMWESENGRYWSRRLTSAIDFFQADRHIYKSTTFWIFWGIHRRNLTNKKHWTFQCNFAKKKKKPKIKSNWMPPIYFQMWSGILIFVQIKLFIHRYPMVNTKNELNS